LNSAITDDIELFQTKDTVYFCVTVGQLLMASYA